MTEKTMRCIKKVHDWISDGSISSEELARFLHDNHPSVIQVENDVQRWEVLCDLEELGYSLEWRRPKYDVADPNYDGDDYYLHPGFHHKTGKVSCYANVKLFRGDHPFSPVISYAEWCSVRDKSCVTSIDPSSFSSACDELFS